MRRQGVLDFLRPDGKSQVSVEYVGNTPKRIEAVVISTQHSPEVSTEELRREVQEAHHRPGGSGQHGRFGRPSSTSIPPAVSWWAGRTAIPA